MRPGAAVARPTPVDDQDTRLMIETLEHGLSRLQGRPVVVRELRREFLGTSSSFRTERVRVVLEAGKPLSVFLKDLNPAHQMEKARALRERDLEPSVREVRMYESVLSPERFGTLHLYATRWEPERGIAWVFLEDGGRALLRNCTDVGRWTAAARWAARFHAATRDLSDAQTSFLPHHDDTHYQRCLARVEQMLPGLAPPEREMVRRGLDSYARRIDWLSALPRTVIHGQFFGQNILLRRRGATHHIAVIDWETAALGPGTFDLASLTAGKWTQAERQAMWAAYFEEYQAATGPRMDWAVFCRELATVALHQSLEWLTWWQHRRSQSRDFVRFMNELARVLDDPFLHDG
jgi:hypothetical protein